MYDVMTAAAGIVSGLLMQNLVLLCFKVNIFFAKKVARAVCIYFLNRFYAPIVARKAHNLLDYTRFSPATANATSIAFMQECFS
jgi:hypothetical protein